MDTDKRRYKRYNVSTFDKLQAKFKPTGFGERLISIGQGGCGLYTLEQPKPHLIPPSDPHQMKKRVGLSLLMTPVLDNPVDIQGTLLNIVEKKIGGKKVFFYCVEFIQTHRELVKPIIETLEEKHQKGEIKLA